MNPLSRIPKAVLFALAGILTLVVLIVIAETLWGDAVVPAPANDQSEENFRLTIDDIENIFVHSGLDIDCPDLRGVAQNSYVYTVVLSGKEAVIERIGCGVGEPENFAQEIAEDLESSGNFMPLPRDQVLEKMTFKFYNITDAE